MDTLDVRNMDITTPKIFLWKKRTWFINVTAFFASLLFSIILYYYSHNQQVAICASVDSFVMQQRSLIGWRLDPQVDFLNARTHVERLAWCTTTSSFDRQLPIEERRKTWEKNERENETSTHTNQPKWTTESMRSNAKSRQRWNHVNRSTKLTNAENRNLSKETQRKFQQTFDDKKWHFWWFAFFRRRFTSLCLLDRSFPSIRWKLHNKLTKAITEPANREWRTLLQPQKPRVHNTSSNTHRSFAERGHREQKRKTRLKNQSVRSENVSNVKHINYFWFLSALSTKKKLP